MTTNITAVNHFKFAIHTKMRPGQNTGITVVNEQTNEQRCSTKVQLWEMFTHMNRLFVMKTRKASQFVCNQRFLKSTLGKVTNETMANTHHTQTHTTIHILMTAHH